MATETIGNNEDDYDTRWDDLVNQNPKAAYGALYEIQESAERLRKTNQKRGQVALWTFHILEKVSLDEMTKISQTIYNDAKARGTSESLLSDVMSRIDWYVDIGRETFGKDNSLTEEERNTAEQLVMNAIDMNDENNTGRLKNEFDTTWLFHGAKVEQIEKIINSGSLMNAGAIGASLNSGNEGISWSSSRIESFPGSRGHIAGFVAAPEAILENSKLAVPTRPAANELLQVSDSLKTKEFFEAKLKDEVWGYGDYSLAERASVDSGLMEIVKNNNGMENNPHLYRFAERGGLPAEELRKHFKIESNGDVMIDTDLHQQRFDENYLPPAAVFMQAMLDQGAFKGTMAENMGVTELIEQCRNYKNLPVFMVQRAREMGKKYADEYDRQLKLAEDVRVPVEKMYFVTSHHDLSEWAKVFAKSGHLPKGILLYDDKKVIRENFAQAGPGGNGDELTAEITNVTASNTDVWQWLGLNADTITRVGTHGQVLRDSEIPHDDVLKMVNGVLVKEAA